jgi:hypothetical protein
MEQYITVKREDGVEVTNPQERNLILLRYAAFLNENGDAQIQQPNVHQIQPQQQVAIQIIEQPQPARKSTKTNVQNAQGANLQQTKVGG